VGDLFINCSIRARSVSLPPPSGGEGNLSNLSELLTQLTDFTGYTNSMNRFLDITEDNIQGMLKSAKSSFLNNGLLAQSQILQLKNCSDGVSDDRFYSS